MNTLLKRLAPPPEQTKETLTIRLPQNALASLDEICQLPQIGISRNALARELIIEGLERLLSELNASQVAEAKAQEAPPTNTNKPLSLNAELAAIYGKDKLSHNACSKHASEAKDALNIDKKDNTLRTKQRIIEWHKSKRQAEKS